MNYELRITNYELLFLPIASAHTVKIAGDVGGTIHIEPNDNPRAGEPAQTWFALTRKGGKVLPLKECNCQLAIYAEPHTPGEPALLEPDLIPVQAERYQGIPGAEITFPKPGVYELQLKGKPVTEANFRPFELKFQVTVTAGKAVAAPQSVQNVAETNQQQSTAIEFIQPIIILAITLLSLGIVIFLVKALKKE
ncbi:hypothetical protein ACSQ6I_09610 [Anabaena sp. WFMT]|uniref:hypothetical protein n=1 Tax=Anabaena sp. WFMT TaxID=3449730 RepID=UPI003F25E4BA